MHSIAESMHLSEPATKIWVKTEPHYRRVFLGRSVKWQWGCRQRQFSRVFAGFSSVTLDIRPALLYSDTQSVVGFSWSQNARPWMTLNGYFALNSVFAPVWLAETVLLSKNNCVKTNKDRHILSGHKSSAGICLANKACADIRLGSL